MKLYKAEKNFALLSFLLFLFLMVMVAQKEIPPNFEIGYYLKLVCGIYVITSLLTIVCSTLFIAANRFPLIIFKNY